MRSQGVAWKTQQVTEDEFAEVLQYLVRSVRDVGLREVSERVLADIRMDPGRPSSQLLRYLDALIAEIRLGSDPTIRKVVASLNDVARTESGRPIDGLRLELAISDQIAFDTEYVDLGIAPDLSAVVDQFERLRDDLAQSRDEF